MGADPKTTMFLKECLADALIKLLETKPIEKITIPEIAQLAGVGRTTYFRNFSSKEEMLTFKIIRLWERWAEEHKLKIRRAFSYDNALTFFEFNYSIRSFLLLLYRRDLQSAIFMSFHSYMQPSSDPDSGGRYMLGFYSYGLFGLLEEWVRGGFAETPEQMEKIVKTF